MQVRIAGTLSALLLIVMLCLRRGGGGWVGR